MKPSRFGARLWAVGIMSTLLIASAALPGMAQENGRWVLRGQAEEPEGGAPPDSWTINSLSDTSISLTVDWVEGHRGKYDFTWGALPSQIAPGALDVWVRADAAIEREGSQSSSTTGVAMDINGRRVLLASVALGCGQANGFSGPIVCSGPQQADDAVSVPIEAGGDGDTLVIEVLSGKCGCTLSWTYAWEGTVSPAAGVAGSTEDETPSSVSVDPEAGSLDPEATRDAGTSGEDAITSGEAIAAGIVSILIAVAIGWLTLAEAGVAISDLIGSGGIDAPGSPLDIGGSSVITPVPESGSAGDPPDGATPPESNDDATSTRDPIDDWSAGRLDRLAQQVEDLLIEDLGRSLPVIPMMEEVDAIRERIASGDATEQDLADLQDLRARALDANEARRVEDETFRERVDGMLEWAGFAQQAGLAGGKGAAGARFGPAAGALVTSVVDTVSAREHGWDRATLIGVTNGAIDGITGGLSGRLRGTQLGTRVSGSAFLNGVAAATQSFLDQFIANGGNVDAVDMDQVYRSGEIGAGFGAVFGTAGDDITSRSGGVPDAPTARVFDGDGPVPRTGSPDVPQTRTAAPDGPGASAPTRQGRPVPDGPAPATTRGAGTPPEPDPGATRAQPHPQTQPNTPDADPGATRAQTSSDSATGARSQTPSDVPNEPRTLPTSAGDPVPPPRTRFAESRWRELDADGAGNVYDSNGNHLYTLDFEGDAFTLDGQQISPLVDGNGPIGYIDGDGRMIAFDARGGPRLIENQLPGRTEVTVSGEVTTLEDLGISPNWVEGGARSSPIEGVPRAATTPRSYLQPDIRSRWAGAAAGPNGELYGRSGSVLGHIDENGRMWTDDGREIVSYSRSGNRIASVRTADGVLHDTD